jgi:mycothiol synthase
MPGMDDGLDLADDLRTRPPVPGDAAAVHAVYVAAELAVQDVSDTTLEDIESDWRRPSFDLVADARVVVDRGRIVAEAEVYKGRRAEAAVHPDARGRGIGSALLRWTQLRARAHGSTLVGQTTPDADRAATELFRRNGYQPMWSSWVLSYAIDGVPLPAELPQGYEFRPFELGTDDREVFDVVERAFSEWPDRDRAEYADWRTKTVEAAGFEPSLQLVIVHGGSIVGTATMVDDGGPGEGWVDQLAVAREHRGRGLGRALLQQGFAVFHARGRASVGLSTDSRTGALGLYEHVGMRVVRSYTHHAKALSGST